MSARPTPCPNNAALTPASANPAACCKNGSKPASPVPGPTSVIVPDAGSKVKAPSPACVAAICCAAFCGAVTPATDGANAPV